MQAEKIGRFKVRTIQGGGPRKGQPEKIFHLPTEASGEYDLFKMPDGVFILRPVVKETE
jgi:hypothetical protein